MHENERNTPEGTGDLLLEQCRARREISTRLTELYEARGFGEVKTPTLEFFDIFNHKSAYFPPEEMFKLIDQKGRLLVLRPDCTIPIARLAATRLRHAPKPLRLYYNQNILQVRPYMKGRSNETTQVGVEVLGASSFKSDLEILETAAHSLELVCADCEALAGEFRIEICHIGFFKSLIKHLHTVEGEAETEAIRRCIEQKSYARLNDLLQPYEEQKAAQALRLLPRLFGEREVIGQAKLLFPEPEAVAVLDYLEALYDGLEAFGLAGKVIVDLGLVNQSEYYTGVIFRGYIHGSGFEVLSGGRYDHLLEEFSSSAPEESGGAAAKSATGFAVYIDRIAKCLLELQSERYERQIDILIHADSANMVNALHYLRQQEGNGKICEISLFDTPSQAKDYARKKGIAELHLCNHEIERIPITPIKERRAKA